MQNRSCEHCGGQMTRRTNEGPGRFAKRRFCSYSCSNVQPRRPNPRFGEANPQWKGDAAGTQTKRVRAQKLYELGDCERCGVAPATERHHIDGDTGNNSPYNVQTLCRRCHMTVDGRLERFVAAKGGRRTETLPPRPCKNCGRLRKPAQLARDRCGACAFIWRKYGVERQAAKETAEAARG